MRLHTMLFACALIATGSLLAFGSQTRASTTTIDQLFAAKDWVNAKATPQLVRGKVVLVDFYTFDCINCKHVEPNLRALYQTKSRADLVIVGVHSPETSYERDRDNLVTSLQAQGVTWPVAVDNDFSLWNAYGVQAWPTQMIFDRSGHLRKTIIGDSQDEKVNSAIEQLLREK